MVSIPTSTVENVRLQLESYITRWLYSNSVCRSRAPQAYSRICQGPALQNIVPHSMQILTVPLDIHVSLKKKKSIYNDPSLELTSVSHVNTGYYLSFIHTEFSRNSTYGINQKKT